MRYRFRYASYDLGELNAGDTVVVRLRGARANVLLLGRRNFGGVAAKLREPARLRLTGGRRGGQADLLRC
jgi:hypothetical protein